MLASIGPCASLFVDGCYKIKETQDFWQEATKDNLPKMAENEVEVKTGRGRTIWIAVGSFCKKLFICWGL